MLSSGASHAGSAYWLRIGLGLVVATMLYNVLEAGVALWAGVAAASLALVEFGLNSLIELAAASVLIWRLRLELRGGASNRIERADRVVHRFVGVSFACLAIYVVVQAGWILWQRHVPDESLVGMLLAGASLVLMPLVSYGKLRAAAEVGSAALRAEAKETLACSYLSFTLLLGLASHAAFGWWWADPAAALLMVPWLVHEAREAFHPAEAEANS